MSTDKTTETYDVAVVGGGSVGLSTAYYLSQSGHENVVLLEKGYFGSGSTGRCGSGIRAQFACRENITTMKRSIELWNELSRDLDFDFHQTGYLYLIYSSDQLERFKKLKKLQNSQGVGTRIISPGEVEEVNGYIDTEEVIAGAYHAGDGKADPFRFTLAVSSYLKEETSIDLRQFRKVEDISEKSTGGFDIHTSQGNLSAKCLVDAAGAWAGEVGQMAGKDIPVEPHKHQAAITEPFRENTVRPMIVSLAHEDVYFTQTEDGGIIGGVGLDEGGPTFDTKETIEFSPLFCRAISDIIPALGQLRLLRHWGGHYVMSPDHNPLIGKYGDHPFYLAAGFSGHGYMMSPVVGKSIAQLITDGDEIIEMDFYDPERIKRGELRESALQMG